MLLAIVTWLTMARKHFSGAEVAAVNAIVEGTGTAESHSQSGADDVVDEKRAF